MTILALLVLVGVVSARPHGFGPVVGSALAVAIASLGGDVVASDFDAAILAQWRPFITLVSIMLITTAAERVGVLDSLAHLIEPRTRGPVRRAFRLTFFSSALIAAVFSNDAAILLLPPTILALLRTVYPRRNPKFLVAFSFAIFAAAGVAPLLVSNPMNLVFAAHVGLGFNEYALVMVPVAIASWVATYAALTWCFRDVLADENPALGHWPDSDGGLSVWARAVLGAVGAVLVALPVAAYLGEPLWPVAAVGAGLVCLFAAADGVAPRSLANGVAWSVFPFLGGVFVLALALERAGSTTLLAGLYGDDPSLATVGTVSAVGSALLNNHPMSLLNGFALEGLALSDKGAYFAALIGGDLGPRLLPIGSLAGLLWFDTLKRHDVEISVLEFVKVGTLITVPSLAVSLGALWLLI